jgi:hypothetical protein
MSGAGIKELSFKAGERWVLIPCTGGSRKTMGDNTILLEISVPSPSLVNELTTRLDPGRLIASCSVAEVPEGTDDRVSVEFGQVTVKDIQQIRGLPLGVVPEGSPGLTGFRVRLVLQPA